MMMPKVSVTVPIYNVERYLRQCLDALSVQTLTDIEFILVDDNSPDGSPAICDEYVAMDNRFRVIHCVENGGLAVARQIGMNEAKGEYVIVCDADDWVEPNMYELLYNKAKSENADICMSDYYVEYADGSTSVKSYDVPRNKIEMVRSVLTTLLPSASWTKMVKREFFLNNGFFYEKGINQGEDYLILMKMVLCNPSISKVDVPLYHYRRVSGSETYTNAPKYTSFEQMLKIEVWKKENFDSRLYGMELFRGSVNNAYLGLRIKEMPNGVYETYLKKNCPWSAFFKYSSFDIKSLLIMLAKVSRPIACYLTKIVGKYFYR